MWRVCVWRGVVIFLPLSLLSLRLTLLIAARWMAERAEILQQHFKLKTLLFGLNTRRTCIQTKLFYVGLSACGLLLPSSLQSTDLCSTLYKRLKEAQRKYIIQFNTNCARVLAVWKRLFDSAYRQKLLKDFVNIKENLMRKL